MNDVKEVLAALTPINLSEGQKMRILRLEKSFEDLAQEISQMIPVGSSDRTHANRLLVTCKMWCSQAIAHEKPEQK